MCNKLYKSFLEVCERREEAMQSCIQVNSNTTLINADVKKSFKILTPAVGSNYLKFIFQTVIS